MSEPLTEAQRSNLALGERVVECYQRKGPWGVYEHFDEFFGPGFEWIPAISQLGDELYRGRDGFHQWITDMEAVASEFWQSLPYVVTIIVVAGAVGRSIPPAAVGKPFEPSK